MEAVKVIEPLAEAYPRYDSVIVGTGVAGLYTALKLPATERILMISKDEVEKSNSSLAQGGICVLKEKEDFQTYMEDTMKAGHYENRRDSVETMIKSSPRVIADLISYGVCFDREEDGSYAYTKEGAHTVPRILHYQDSTGKEITRKLIRQVEQAENITVMPYTKMVDLICYNNSCQGIVIQTGSGEYQAVYSHNTILATGGIGGLFSQSTNYPHIAGDSFALAIRHKIQLENLNYIQIHPTAFYDEASGRRFLISEAVRGEGGILLNEKGERFVNELKPRDVVSQAISTELKRSGRPYVYLSFENIPTERIERHFPGIFAHCLEKGYDIRKEPIPVTPAQHYIMGGIRTGLSGETSCRHLYAVGETACNGVHGANRLASNSLLESLVFAERAARKIGALPATEYEEKPQEKYRFQISEADREKRFRELIMREIKRKDEQFYVKWCNDGAEC